ncbi:DUF305 domain-containing protein [Parafrigoribacterium mesophilum]|uniref:DUF305 domain-containing protein n=1 Tax=Parafrigoribacterium mesophilum TaxID=433646 RepID=UPI0031FE1FC1
MAQVESDHRLPTRLIVAIILGAALLLAVGIGVGRLSVPNTAIPDTFSAEAGFARDMQTHHLQAVELSMIIRDATDDQEIRSLAYDIATAQSQQSGQMHGWLNVWGLPQAAPEPSMTWITRPAPGGSGHSHGALGSGHVPGARMPGLATDDQLAQLRSLTGVEAEKLFLQLMIAHHNGGIEMAEAVLDRTTNKTVSSLARGMVKAQQSEVDYMEGLLARRR